MTQSVCMGRLDQAGLLETLSGTADLSVSLPHDSNTARDDFWSALYVLLSRATRMEDMLLLRCPPKSFFDEGPPAYLKNFLRKLHGEEGKIAAGQRRGDELIRKYGWRVPS